MITQKRLKELLHYAPKTGTFTWLISPRGRTRPGDVAGGPDGHGYYRVQMEGIRYRAARLAWFYVYGCWPTVEVDHINGDRSDNRIKNLREATRAQQNQNLGIGLRNKTGILGVSWNKERKKWRAEIKIDNKSICLGRYRNIDDARAAYLKAKAKYHKFQPTIREHHP
mgnify:CR=1 FL=1